MTTAADWTDSLCELDVATLPVLFPDPRVPSLDAPRAVWRKTQHQAEDKRGASNARQLIERLPGPDESLHLLWSGQWRHATIVPVILDLAGCSCQLAISTLGFDDRCIELLVTELDAGRIQRIDALSSIYHAAHNPHQSRRLTDELSQRGSRHRAGKIHAKVLSFEFIDGRAVVVESSSNLRSCAMLELSVISGDPALGRWHAKWISEILDREAAR